MTLLALDMTMPRRQRSYTPPPLSFPRARPPRPSLLRPPWPRI